MSTSRELLRGCALVAFAVAGLLLWGHATALGAEAQEADGGWSKPVNGLRCKLYVASHDPAKTKAVEALTFELQNVSDRAIAFPTYCGEPPVVSIHIEGYPELRSPILYSAIHLEPKLLLPRQALAWRLCERYGVAYGRFDRDKERGWIVFDPAGKSYRLQVVMEPDTENVPVLNPDRKWLRAYVCWTGRLESNVVTVELPARDPQDRATHWPPTGLYGLTVTDGQVHPPRLDDRWSLLWVVKVLASHAAFGIQDARGRKVEVIGGWAPPGGWAKVFPGEVASPQCIPAGQQPFYDDVYWFRPPTLPNRYRHAFGLPPLETGRSAFDLASPDKSQWTHRIAEALRREADSITFQVVCVRDGKMPLRSLRLNHSGMPEKLPPDWTVVEIDGPQLDALISHLADAGHLWRALVERTDDKTFAAPCYFLSMTTGNTLIWDGPGKMLRDLFTVPLGWGEPMYQKLLALRRVLTGDAAKGMDKLLAALEPCRKQWQAIGPAER
ncbi:MAG: hypothetical protein FJ290_09935 [Planctomycetes bacterium]|nr:hypothetical protein [Planctomycetota bacterium]